jgi:hypothetical protein
MSQERCPITIWLIINLRFFNSIYIQCQLEVCVVFVWLVVRSKFVFLGKRLLGKFKMFLFFYMFYINLFKSEYKNLGRALSLPLPLELTLFWR